MKRLIIFMIIAILFLMGCASKEYEYSPSGYESCDYSAKDRCMEKGCRWQLMTDAISDDRPTPATCCPKDVVPSFNPTKSNDPCQVMHG